MKMGLWCGSLLAAALLSGCDKEAEVNAAPLEMRVYDAYQFGGLRASGEGEIGMMVYELLPERSLDGEFKLMLVQGGEVKDERALKFSGLSERGAVAVITTKEGLALDYDFKCESTTLGTSLLALPEGAVNDGSSHTSGESRVTEGESVIYETHYSIGGQKISGKTMLGGLEDALQQTRENPSLAIVLLSMKLEP
ncbi:hypothetical protein SAMN02745181_0402 [Rubritalea squalenifaciens DSM 18772]|uniref:Lipoprotein n=1 Tax=Rubritalea squalenifaciens DSM 18772 TaxID=1123071 RepID=A0A1M6C6P7_9BACT|nr:hypothetical protein [Rubritalea squalenifaciens]SHI56662.1 hypothetical protein SAMN02745181_0402 [Rubritalea squalenifaciens DSM 18772]